MQLPEFLSFKGTASRADWWAITINSAIIEALALAGGLIGAFKSSPPFSYLFLFLCGSILILALIATLAVAARRFRDLSLSPWHTFLYFIPYFGWALVWIPCGFLSGKRFKTRRRTVSKSSPS